MHDIIQLLPDAIANQIAAGEVVQRPASVVKELLENALDAGAKHIQLVVREAGRTLVQVIDDGTGMSVTDARMSFERHATSKIRTAQDLFNIRTKGFRGEALASIAAVAQVEMRTRRPADELGTLLQVEGSELVTQEACQCPAGTQILVKNLFFNVPARRNFLKSNPVEMRHIIDEFQRVALAHPEVAFSLTHNDSEVYQLPATKLPRRVVDIFGKNYREQLAETHEETPFVQVSGYLSKPGFARKVRGEQFFFVNNRFIKHAYLHHAVLSGLEGLIPEGHHPFYVLNIDIDPAHIDINVHPTKTEIKFDDERSVYAIVRAAVKRATGVYGLAPAIDFELDVNHLAKVTPGNGRAFSAEKSSDQDSGLRAFPKRNTRNWEQLFEGLEASPAPEKHSILDLPEQVFPTERPFQPPAGELPPSLTFQSRANRLTAPAAPETASLLRAEGERQVFQVHNRYLLCQVSGGLLLIDQRAALERILFEEYTVKLEKRTGASQQLLFPKHFILNPADFILMQELQEEIRALGFELTEIGRDAFRVEGIPAELSEDEPQGLLESLLEHYKLHQAQLNLSRKEALARALAKRTAARYLRKLQPEEINTLLDQLAASPQPGYTPSGEVIYTLLGLDRLGQLLRPGPF